MLEHFDSSFIQGILLRRGLFVTARPFLGCFLVALSRVIALPSIKYSGSVEADVFES